MWESWLLPVLAQRWGLGRLISDPASYTEPNRWKILYTSLHNACNTRVMAWMYTPECYCGLLTPQLCMHKATIAPWGTHSGRKYLNECTPYLFLEACDSNLIECAFRSHRPLSGQLGTPWTKRRTGPPTGPEAYDECLGDALVYWEHGYVRLTGTSLFRISWTGWV